LTQVFSFPTAEDRELIQFAITSFAQGKTDRDTMMRQVAHILSKYNITKLPMNGYTVKVDHCWDVPVVIVEGSGVHDHCPSCLSPTDHARYLRTHQENKNKAYDVITVFCLECGTIYDCKAPNGRVAIW